MYSVTQIQIDKKHELYNYCDRVTRAANNNAIISTAAKDKKGFLKGVCFSMERIGFCRSIAIKNANINGESVQKA